MGAGVGKIIFGIAYFTFVLFCGATSLCAQAVPGLDAIRVASGLTQPLFVTAPPGDFNRIFIVQQTGQVRILNLATGTMNTTPFLDISARLTATNGEQGLLGLAFDPNYTTNGKFYLNFTVPGGAFGNGTTHISQFQVSANPDVADISNEKILLTFDHPEANHNGGWIGFSPRAGDDHNLYIATGDGGAGNDQGNGHIEPGGNAQNKTTLLGKMLRIHVDPTTATYTIPSDNPFFGSATLKQEIWLFGLRNPFRDSFDRSNGRMFIGDVGQDTREEIDVQQATNPGGGENYGWRLREGTIATPTGNPVVGGSPPPGNVDPILDYPHTTGRTVIGGYIYRGPQLTSLQGVYVFGDYLGPSGGSARVFTLNYDGTTASNFQDITSLLFPIPTTGGNVSLVNLSSLGEDAAGELYLTDIGNGNVYKISPMPVSAASRRIHGSTPRDLNLPLTGAPGVECRSGGANGNYTMIFTFAVPLASVGGRSVTAGIGSVSSSMIDSTNAHQYIVNLTGVTNSQYITVTLTNVIDVAGNTSSAVSAAMGVLVGDTNADGFVNSADISQTKSESGNAVTTLNFREDVNVDGFINSADISFVKSMSGSALPPPPSSPGASASANPTAMAPRDMNGNQTSPTKAKAWSSDRPLEYRY
jgi:glucose/arabinose dehydrogenase